ncbi:gamma carbonic anhydrase family protein [bacterium]|nr:MAG: gamma carbonic anhydrase family protein [bacterium]
MIRAYDGKNPDIHPDAFIAETAVLIGDVKIGADSSVWYGAVIRGDINKIHIGKCSNVQDNTVIHVDTDKPVIMGDNVTVGHNAILHGCKVGDCVLIGMGATVLDGAEIGEAAIIGAGAVVLEGEKVPAYTLMAGVPAKPIKKLDQSIKEKLHEHAKMYAQYAKSYSK